MNSFDFLAFCLLFVLTVLVKYSFGTIFLIKQYFTKKAERSNCVDCDIRIDYLSKFLYKSKRITFGWENLEALRKTFLMNWS